MKIKVKDLHFSYDGKEFQSQPVLEGVYLDVEEGQILAVVGPNGSGKTTLLKNIAGVLKPAKGAVYLDMKEVTQLSTREIARHLAAMEQERRVGFNFTVDELVELGRIPHLGRFERQREKDRKTIIKAMQITKTAKFADRPIGQLSGGEKQRVFLAMALAQEPEVFLLDEPTAHLDINYQIEIMEIIKERAAAGLTVIMALHDLNLAAYYANRIAMLSQGRLIAIGSPQEVLTEDSIKRAFQAEVSVGRNPLTNSIYINIVTKKGNGTEAQLKGAKLTKLHIVCGGGSGVEVMHALASDYRLSVGVISPMDSDFEAARHLGAEIIMEAPFSPISDEAYQRNLELMKECAGVIVCETPFGPGNIKNLKAVYELLVERSEAYMDIYLINPDSIQERDYTNGKATKLIDQILATAVPVSSLKELREKLTALKGASTR